MDKEPLNIEPLFDGMAAEARCRRVEQRLDAARTRRLDRAAIHRRHLAGAVFTLLVVAGPMALMDSTLSPTMHFSSLLGHSHSLATATAIVAAL